MLRTALRLSAAAMLMLSTSAIAQNQDYGEAQIDLQAQAEQPDASMPEGDALSATIEQHEEGVIEPKADESPIDDPHGLDAADALARSDTPEDSALAEDADANDPDRLAQASPPDPDLLQQEMPDEDQMTDASSNNGPDLEPEPNALQLEPMPELNEQQ